MEKDQILSNLRSKLSRLADTQSQEKHRAEVRYSIGLIEGAALSGLLDIEDQRVLLAELFAINDEAEMRLGFTTSSALPPDHSHNI